MYATVFIECVRLLDVRYTVFIECVRLLDVRYSIY